jgi:nicotinamidase-related amidase
LSWPAAVPDPTRAAVFSADMINGFCYTGNLASLRIAAIVPPVVRLFEGAHVHGIRNFVLLQEWHSPHAEEFHAFAPHGIRETPEAETVPELATLPFAANYTILRKNSVSPAANPLLDQWLAAHPIETAIVVGDFKRYCVRSTRSVPVTLFDLTRDAAVSIAKHVKSAALNHSPVPEVQTSRLVIRFSRVGE